MLSGSYRKVEPWGRTIGLSCLGVFSESIRDKVDGERA